MKKTMQVNLKNSQMTLLLVKGCEVAPGFTYMGGDLAITKTLSANEWSKIMNNTEETKKVDKKTKTT